MRDLNCPEGSAAGQAQLIRSMSGTYGIRPNGYRLPDETRIGGVRLQVADLSRSLDYYTRVLGFRVLSRGDGRAALGSHGDAHALV